MLYVPFQVYIGHFLTPPHPTYSKGIKGVLSKIGVSAEQIIPVIRDVTLA